MSLPARNAVWVWLARGRDGKPHPALGELLHEARGLARRLEAPLVALGDRPAAPEERGLLAAWGAASLRQVGTPQPAHPVIGAGRSPLAALAGGPPRVTLFLADPCGEVAAPLWAAECGAVYLPGVTGITHDGRAYVAARPTLGGQYEALVRAPPDTPLVVTLLPGSLGDVALPPPVAGAHLAVEPLADGTPGAEAPPAAVYWPPRPETLAIGDAERIVAFGRGAFSPQAVALVERLARLLGAAVAGTRPAADEGWLPFARQVGLTGAVVSPRLYLAVGISGAPYHMAGVKDPHTLIAVNSDPEAPILAAAHLGIVGDLHRVLPALIGRLERGGIPLPGGGVLRPAGTGAAP